MNRIIFLIVIIFAYAADSKSSWGGSSLRENYAPPAANELKKYLAEHPRVQKQILWADGTGREVAFANWAAEDIQSLFRFLDRLEKGQKNLDVKCENPRKAADENQAVFYHAANAKSIFLAHVAHVLHVELNHLVPWHLEDLSDQELGILLSAQFYFVPIWKADSSTPKGFQAGRDYVTRPEEYWSQAAICEPQEGYRFLSGETSTTKSNLIGSTREQTLRNITLFMRDNVLHADPDAKNEGLFYLRERLSLPKSMQKEEHKALLTAGCQGAAKLIMDLGRSVNLPLLIVETSDLPAMDSKAGYFSGHRGLVFNWGHNDPRILWHTDLVYAEASRDAYSPIDKSGHRVSASAGDELFFSLNWLSANELKEFGFEMKIQNRPNPGTDESLDTFRYLGWHLGRWNHDEALEARHLTAADEVLCAKGPIEKACASPSRSQPTEQIAKCIQAHEGCERIKKEFVEIIRKRESSPLCQWTD